MKLSQLPQVRLHHLTIKAIKQKHPWVTLDEFSKRFPTDSDFLLGIDEHRRSVAILLNDPNHKQVKARVWSFFENGAGINFDFVEELSGRLDRGFFKRINLIKSNERDNFYLIFGEGDALPGLFIQRLGAVLLVQYYSNFWEKFERELLAILRQLQSKYFEEKKYYIYIQKRNSERKIVLYLTESDKSRAITQSYNFELQEFGVNYSIKLGEGYDVGLYTDMASVRKKIIPLFQKSKKILNLYAYTGAFSLLAMSKEVGSVTSVDVSGKYLAWLEENIRMNKFSENITHRAMKNSVEMALTELVQKEECFDFIICDPPSASSDGKKISAAFTNYDKIFLKMVHILAENGSLLIFLNTHTITYQKFEKKIREILTTNKLDNFIKIEKHFSLGDDCPITRGFSEGNYLKGILLKKNSFQGNKKIS